MKTPQERIRLRREKYHEADAVVVGAGIFGCAIAYALAQQGRSVLLLERWMQEPDRIVGELLQPGGLNALRKLGLGHCVEEIDSIPCSGYNVIFNGEPTKIPYPGIDDNGLVTYRWSGHSRDGEGKRPTGRGFHHGRFITQLRKACIGHENITVVETEVVSTIKSKHTDEILGVETRTTDRETREKTADCFFAHLTIIADGYASKFRKEVFTTQPVSKSKFYALELIDCPLPQPGYGHVIIGSHHFPVLLYQIGTHETRALFDVPTDLPEASAAQGGVRNYMKNVAIPSLPAHIQDAANKAMDDGKIPRSMPNSWLPPSKQTQKRLLVLGDAMNMRHPLTGGGMTVAFNDVVIISELLHPDLIPSLENWTAIDAAMHEHYWRRKSFTGIINVLAQALYALFAANDKELRALQLGCFEYFQRGMIDGPVGLLAGIIHQPLVLAYHFFSVAFLAIWLNTCSVVGNAFGIWKTPLAVVDAFLILWKACVVFVPMMWREGFR